MIVYGWLHYTYGHFLNQHFCLYQKVPLKGNNSHSYIFSDSTFGQCNNLLLSSHSICPFFPLTTHLCSMLMNSFPSDPGVNAFFCGIGFAPRRPHDPRWSGSDVKTTGGGFAAFLLHIRTSCNERPTSRGRKPGTLRPAGLGY